MISIPDLTRFSLSFANLTTCAFSFRPHTQTQIKMELWNISNVRAALETGKLKSPVPEQADMP